MAPATAGPALARTAVDYASAYSTHDISVYVTERSTHGSSRYDYKQPYYQNTEWFKETTHTGPNGDDAQSGFTQQGGLQKVVMTRTHDGSVVLGDDTPVQSNNAGSGDFLSQWKGCE